MHRNHLGTRVAIALLLAVALPLLSKAQDTLYWTGASDSQWSNAANWSASSGGPGGAGVPDGSTVTVFDENGTADCHVGGDGSAGTLDVTGGYSGTLYIDGAGGVFTVSGSIVVGGGTVTALDSIISVGDSLYVGSGGTVSDSSLLLLVEGNLSMDGGTFYGLGGHAHYNGAMHLYGGSYVSGHDLTFYGGMYDPDGVFQPVGGTAYANGSGSFYVLNGFNDLVLADSTIDTLNSDLIILDRLTLGDASILRLNETNPTYSLGVQLYLLGDPTSLSPDGTSGIMVPDDNATWANYVAWHVGDQAGTYTIPFISQGGDRTTVSFEVQVPGGDGDGLLFFSTYPTDASATPNNQPYPVGVESFYEGLSGFYPEYAADRYWLVGAFNYNYGAPPKGRLSLQYATADVGGANTITEGALRLMAFDGGSTLDTIAGPVDTATHTLAVDSLQLFNPYTVVLLYDSGGIGKVFPPDSIPPQWACSDTDVVFTFDSVAVGVGGDQIEWSLDSTFASSTIVSPPATITVTVAPGSTETIWVRGRNSVSGHVSAAIYTTTTVYPSASVTVSPADTLVILGQTVTLRATGTGSFGWTGLGGTADTVDVTPTADSTWYTVTLTDSNGCVATDTSLVRTMAFPTITVVNHRDTINSGDTVDIDVYPSDPAMYVAWSRNNLTNVSGGPSGTGTSIGNRLDNNTRYFQTVYYTVYGTLNGYYANPVQTKVVVRPYSSPSIQGLTVDPLPSATLVACMDTSYSLVVSSTNPASFSVRLVFAFQPAAFAISDTADFMFSQSGDTVLVSTRQPFQGMETLKVSFRIPCSAIPNTSGVDSLSNVLYISVLDPNGNPYSGLDTTITNTLLFPYLSSTSQNVLFDTLTYHHLDTLDAVFTNSASTGFSGSIRIDRDTGCGQAVISVDTLTVLVGTSVDTVIPNPVFPVVLPQITVPVGSTMTIREIDSVVGCIPSGGCSPRLILHWGCSLTDICKNDTVNRVEVRSSGNPSISVSRVLPLPASMDANQIAFDSACTKSYTNWEYVIENTGIVPVYSLAVFLSQKYPNRNFTYILADSISIETDTSFPNPVAYPNLLSPPLASKVDTMQTSDFAPSVPTACFDSLSDHGTRVIKSYRDTVPVLLPGQRVVLRFKTYRCCPTDIPFNTGATFNLWNLTATGNNECGAPFSGHPEAAHMVFVSPNNVTTTTYNPYYGGYKTIAADTLKTPNLNLVQVSSPNNPHLLTGGHSACGTLDTFRIKNTSFVKSINGQSNYNVQLFSPSGSGSVVGNNPRGQFKVAIACQNHIRVDVNPPVIEKGGVVWPAQSATWQWADSNATAIFDLADLPNGMGLNTDTFLHFFVGSDFRFLLSACCPIPNDQDPFRDIVVSTYFNPNAASCDTCWVPLSQRVSQVEVHCPGCVTPGIISNDSLARINLGFEDGDDDGMPDGVSLTRIGPGYAHPVAKKNAVVGDTLETVTTAFFEDGDASRTGGFTYADWQDFWGGTGPGRDSVRFSHLIIQHKVHNADTLGLTCISATLEYYPDSMGTPDTIALITGPVSANADNNFLFDVPDSLFGTTARYLPGDNFVVRQRFVVCQNPDSVTEIKVENYMYLTLDTVSGTDPYHNYCPIAGTDTLGISSHGPGNCFLYYCDQFSDLGSVYPVYRDSQYVYGSHTCSYPDEIRISSYIASHKVAGNARSSTYENVFPYEYRLVPGIDPANYQNGPNLAGAPAVFAHFPVPHDLRVSIDSIKTVSYSHDSLNNTLYIATSVKQGVSTPVILPTYLPIDGQASVDMMTNDTYVTYSPPFRALGFTATASLASLSDTLGGRFALGLGDENFEQHFFFAFSPRCDSATLGSSNIPQDSVYAVLPGVGCDSLGLDHYIRKFRTQDPSGCNCWVRTVPHQSTLTTSVSSATFQGSYVDWQVTFVDTAAHPNAYPSNMVVFISDSLFQALGIDTLKSGSTCDTLLRDTLVPGVNGDMYHRYYLGGEQPFCISVRLKSCNTSLSIPFSYSWSCDGVPDTLPPGVNKCFATQTFVLDTVIGGINLAPYGYDPPLPTYMTCQRVPYRACLRNSLAGGAGDITESFVLSNTVGLDTLNVVVRNRNHTDTLGQALVSGLPGTTQTEWRFDTDSLTALNSTHSIFGVNGLTNSDSMCVSFVLVPKCNDTVIPAFDFKFRGRAFCGDTFLVQYHFAEVAVAGNLCGPFFTLSPVDTSCGFGGAAIDSIWAGAMPYTYSWSTGDTTISTDSLVNGTLYYVTVTDTAGCYTTDSITFQGIASGIADSLWFVPDTAASCSGLNSIYSYVAHAAGTVHYLWSTGDTTKNLYSVSGGTYSLTVVDDSCRSSASIVVPSNAGPTVVFGHRAPSCNGLADGTDTAYVVAGLGPYEYHWSHSAVDTASFGGLAAGAYSVTVKGANGCSGVFHDTIPEPAVATVTLGPVLPSCTGNNGSLTATAGGGTPGFSYNWSNGDSTSTIGGLAAGTYAVTVTDAHGCTAADSVVVPGGSDTVRILSTADTVCNGTAITLSTSPGGWGSYLWGTGGTGSTITVAPAADTSYTVAVVDAAGCNAADTIAIHVLSAPSIVLDTLAHTACDSFNVTRITVYNNGSTYPTYAWSTLPNMAIVSQVDNGDSSTVAIQWTDYLGGTVTVTATDTATGCTTTLTDTVAPCCNGVLGITGPLSNCSYNQNKYYVTSPIPGAHYTWATVGAGSVTVSANTDTLYLYWTGSNPPYTVTLVADSGLSACGQDTAVLSVLECCYKGGNMLVDTGYNSPVLDGITVSRADSNYRYLPNHGGSYQSLRLVQSGGYLALPPNVRPGIFVNGTLTVDVDLWLSHAWLYMGPDAKILVRDSVSLILDSVYVSVLCDTMWKGIELDGAYASLSMTGDSVADADTAVYAKMGGSVGIHSTRFRQNLYGVVVDGVADTGLYPLVLDGVELVNTDSLAHYPHAGLRGKAGFVARGIPNIRVGSHAHVMNTFQGWDTAVCLSNTGGVVANDSIVGDTADYYKGVHFGVFTYGNHGTLTSYYNGHFNVPYYSPGPSLLLGDDSIYPSLRILGCGFGIDGQNYTASTLEIANDTIHSNDSLGYNIAIGGFARYGALSTGSRVWVHNNRLASSLVGLFSVENRMPFVVRDNTVDMSPATSASRAGIVFYNFSSFDATGDSVTGNTVKAAYTGISGANRLHQYIGGNTVGVVANGNGNVNGIYQSACYNSLVACNTVTGTDSTHENYQFGLRLEHSTGTVAQCNQLRYLGRGISNHYQARLWLWDNRMDTCAVGIAVANQGMIGRQGIDSVWAPRQPWPPTIFYVYDTSYDNQWRGAFASGMLKSYSSIGDSSHFYVRDSSGSPFDPPVTVSLQGAGAVMPATSIVPQNTIYDCTDSCPHTTRHIGPNIPWPLVQLLVASAPFDTVQQHWWDRYNLAIILQDADTSAWSDSIVGPFLDSFAMSATGRLLTIQAEMDTLDITDSVNYAELNSEIGDVSTDNDMDGNMKGYLGLYLYSAKNGITGEITSAVNSIAEQCVYDGGPSVLEARAFMVGQDLSLLNYDWDTLCTSGGGYKMARGETKDSIMAKQSLDYRLIPNLYKDNFTARITLGADESGEVQIYAMDGRLMGQHSVTSGSNQLDLVNDGLIGGVYIYRVIVNGQIKNNGKLVVVH